MPKKLHIIWPVFNAADSVVSCIRNMNELAKSALTDYDVVISVFDDGSQDGTGQVLQEENVQVYSGDGEAWWSGGMNGILANLLEQTTGPGEELVMLWGNDLRVDPAYFEAVLKSIQYVEEFPEHIVGATILYENGEIFSRGFKHHWNGREENVDNKKLFASEDLQQGYKEVDWMAGMGFVTTLSAFVKVGLFDALHCPQYFGDTEWFMRAKRKGMKSFVNYAWLVENDISNTGLGNSYRDFKSQKVILREKRSRFYWPAYSYYTREYNHFPIGIARLVRMRCIILLKSFKARLLG